MSGIDIEGAIIAASGNRPGNLKVQAAIDGMLAVKEWLDGRGAFDTPERLAHLIGQCAHESAGFTRTEENLNYTSAARIKAVFGKGRVGRLRFPSLADAQPFVRDKIALANKVYGGRMGNTHPNDGYKYRGRGYIQLTGRDNYRVFGMRVGLELIAWPELARRAPGAWQIAASYFASRRRLGKTAFEWADENNVEMTTRIVNGGLNGLADRRVRTAAALAALQGG